MLNINAKYSILVRGHYLRKATSSSEELEK